MRTHVYEGILTATSSLSHVGDGGGRVHPLRRESIVGADGGVLAVPVISGAVIRGRMRRLGASMVVERLGEHIPVGAALALAQGGVLSETRTAREVLTGERQARLRSLVPFLGLFGTAGGGRIMPGRVMMSKAIPIAAETVHLLPPHIREHATAGGGLPSVFELMAREGYSTATDSPTIAAMVGQEVPEGSPMRYEVETLIAGTRLYQQVVGEDLTADEGDCLEDVMRLWGERARVGGGRSRGMGHVAATYTRTVTNPYGEPAEPEEGDWVRTMTADMEATRLVLSWL